MVRMTQDSQESQIEARLEALIAGVEVTGVTGTSPVGSNTAAT